MNVAANRATVEFETPHEAAQFTAKVRAFREREGGVELMVGDDGYHAVDAHRHPHRERDQYEPHDEVHTFRITFGQKYLREEHPVLAEITGNSFVEIVADNREAAREYAHRVFGANWAFEYGHVEWESVKELIDEKEPRLRLVDPAFSMRFLQDNYR